MKLAKIKINKNKTNELANYLQNIKPFSYANRSSDMVILAREKYYFRHNSTQMNMIIIKTSAERSEIDIIGGAGGVGILKFSWWSEHSFIKKTKRHIEQFCRENGLIMEELS